MKRYETGTSKDVTELLLCPSSTAGTVAARGSGRVLQVRPIQLKGLLFSSHWGPQAPWPCCTSFCHWGKGSSEDADSAQENV